MSSTMPADILPTEAWQIEPRDFAAINRRLKEMSASDTLQWTEEVFGDGMVLTTSFGIQSAVLLHMATQIRPDVPVIWIDTGYLPRETYEFADHLTRRLNLNLHTYRSELSPANMERIHGRLWESDDVRDLQLYDQIRKVEPLQRAMKDLWASAWISGIRSEQTQFRSTLSPFSHDGQRYKVLPLLGWSSRDVYQYLQAHDLPYHPLFEQGYASVGDWHSSRALRAGDEHERQTRFRGLKEECGIHLPATTSSATTSLTAA